MVFQFSIVSGKGGVGKTTITAAIACEMKTQGINLLTIDCDVDAPNLELLFQHQEEEYSQINVQTTNKAVFILENCTHCKKCINDNFCFFDALSWNTTQSIPKINVIACEGCKACELLCHQKAFFVRPVDSGIIKNFNSLYGFPVITGETILGAQTSGKLVMELRSYAQKIAQAKDIKMVIIDGPPGIGCPVIATLSNINYTIVIIEPNSVALHDAIRVINIIKRFNTSIGVIINKADLWEPAREMIHCFLKNEKIDLLGEIELDQDWPYAITQSLPINIYKPMGKSALQIKLIVKNILLKNEVVIKNLMN